ncbi:MAG: cation-translocating P-type ATPase [Bacteroidota bacterium]
MNQVQASKYEGLNDNQIHESRKKFGPNVRSKGVPAGLRIFVGVLAEPMLLLLVVACIIYFILGSSQEGYIMAGAILFVAGISVFQQYRSEHALKALGRLTAHPVQVIRNGRTQTIPSVELVCGDIMIVTEGEQVNADADLMELNDLSVDESILTGESLPVDDKKTGSMLFAGSTVVNGVATARVTHVGDATRLGGMGLLMEQTKRDKTPLEKQVGSFVRTMAFFGATAFLFVWLMNYIDSRNIIESLMHGLTLAMAVLPEEIPVALATFMALGAYRMAKKGVLARHPQTVESLGAATVICLDKTGTITQNRMETSGLYLHQNTSFWLSDGTNPTEEYKPLMHHAFLACEQTPFDPMERAIKHAFDGWYGSALCTDMIREYPLSGRPPMMTHVHRSHDGICFIAVKGAVEAVLPNCRLSVDERRKIMNATERFAKLGHRVLAVAEGVCSLEKLPDLQQDIPLRFLGLVSLSDPPKPGMAEVISGFYNSGIDVKMITGDHPHTAKSIAEEIGIKNVDSCLTGDDIMAMEDERLDTKVMSTSVFARIAPEAKLRIIEALKRSGAVVAMTGDGVNDAPALKAADIGVSMGRHGSEVARQASSLVLLDDDLGAMVKSIALGRTIYNNLKRAISYIIAIHIPLISIVTFPLLFGWEFANLFSPVHIIFLELIMGPTCSIVFENEPAVKDVMTQSPRRKTESLFTIHELGKSILRGGVITIALLTTLYLLMSNGFAESGTRTVVFIALVLSNILLTFTGRSETESIIKTIRYRNILIPIMASFTIFLLLLVLYWTPAADIFGFIKPTSFQWLLGMGVASVAVLWIEIYKSIRRA